MACNSIQSTCSSSSQMIWKYDVFVSFRGEDTRNNFTDHLFGALRRKGVVAFKDDTKLKKGEPIAPELLQAIERSQILIVVFSKNYASSTWCLRELAKIADCIHVRGQTVLPIFYDVNPSDVRKQSGNYEKAFVEHEEKFREDLEKMVEVQSWREALKHVAHRSGWDIRDKPQYAEIEKVVEKIISVLSHKFPGIPDYLVGMQSPVEELEKLLLLDSPNDVRVVGICGMGGIGKSTLATVVCERISPQFESCCFIDVSETYRLCGPIGAQKQLLCQTLNEENLHICNHYGAADLIRSRLCHLRALIVLDNVDQVEQLEKLAVNRQWLGAGSRIIIISRDQHVLKEYGVDEIYIVKLLNGYNALRLFCKKAFKCDDIMRDYEDLTYDALYYANGLPLAIKVLGSFLYDRDISEWRSALARLREYPSKDVMDVLRVSFDGLEEMEKEIFLDIACFSYEFGETYVEHMLNYHGFDPKIGIRVLIDKSLITREKGRRIWMHNLLKELGRSIVREKTPKEPRKWSRLWDSKDLHNVMLENKESENLEAIAMELIYHSKNPETTMKAGAISKMSHLKLLILCNVNFSGNLNHLSHELVYLTWVKYPFPCLPPSFQPDKLIQMILPHSSIKQLWEGSKLLPNLRYIDVSHSKNLIKLPDFREFPNLEDLVLEGCISLVYIDPSIGFLKKLVHLNLKDCKNLVYIPDNIFGLSSLKRLNLSGCSKLLNNRVIEKARHAEHLEKLEIIESTMQWQSTSSFYKFLKLPFHIFNSARHEDSVGLFLTSLPHFQFLSDLDLSFCNLLQIPDAIGWLHSLERLNLGGNNFITLPSSLKELSNLHRLNLEHCKQLKYMPELPSTTALSKSSIRRFRAGLYIYDCPKLCVMERCYSMAFSWIIQLLKVHMQSSFTDGEIEIVIPGSQIPRWFNKQNVGSSMSIDPSPIMCDENWIGVACCVAFVAHDDPTNLGDTRERVSKSYFHLGFQTKKGGSFSQIPIHLEKNLVTVELDHLLIHFLTRESFLEHLSYFTKRMHDFLDGIKLDTTFNLQPEGLHLEVTICGYRWIFKEDLEQLNPQMMYSRNSAVQKHKFLTNGLADIIELNNIKP